MARIKLLHVTFKDSGPALVDLIGGQIDMMFDQDTDGKSPGRCYG